MICCRFQRLHGWINLWLLVPSSLQLGLADRSLMPGDVVRRLIPGQDTQGGYCKDVKVRATIQIVGTQYVIPHVSSRTLSNLEVLLTHSWVNLNVIAWISAFFPSFWIRRSSMSTLWYAMNPGLVWSKAWTIKSRWSSRMDPCANWVRNLWIVWRIFAKTVTK